MDSMQYEALRRAQEMQQRRTPPHGDNSRAGSRPSVRGQSSSDAEQRHTPPEASKPSGNEHKESEPEHKKEPCAPSDTGKRAAEGLFADKEKLLILALILVLSEENTDPAVLLALLYIII